MKSFLKSLKTKNIFKITLKKLLLIVVLWFMFVIAHNLFYAIFGFEEGVFFILAVIVVPLYFIISVLYTIFIFLKKGFN